MQRVSFGRRPLLHRAEPADELLVRALQRRLGIDSVETAGIYQREEEVAEFALQPLLVPGQHLGVHLRDLLLHLRPYILALLPVEARGGRLLAHAEGLHHGGQRAGHAAQRTALAVLLAQLQRFPILLYGVGRVGMDIAVDMRMAIDQLVAQGIDRRRIVEGTGLLTQLGIEYDMQQQVADLLLDPLQIVVQNGICQLIGLLDGIVSQRIESLLPVPGALLAQGVHHLQQAFGRRQALVLFHSIRYYL